ncbi:LLM class flavin-dependent oxidoreductase [Rhodococcus opacus]|uniref:F420-dependent picric acid reductase n=2 Tax=Rhodococcus TaxID=1827 RepID=Q9AH03_RHOER|nr:LLM class flavin-dependent oxidoreductase [Rhodococcus opacus]AAK38104.1 F420-dependent picric acid reductase [Rhodococcus erythropolis]MBA8963660.1 alkanesulfonate monooxygenase SsuD/methylene tetrahydromethanopterin reductase-like flavin-dependent oxidoreductase (luciferase family) [Rhodococcus opacus]MBP2207150.1 alkanesulfonate monooxygenase SsuD/methylene tetrahydromethanopterin reductase-like flavin-dependent oxidoreductase (luciferase family) [Rhodococcus opacus]
MIKGIQLHGWADGPQMVEVAEIAAGSFETVWLSDQLQSRGVAVLLGAIAARTGVGVGTAVTFPFGRNPLEMASSMATLAEFMPEGRRVTMGIGTGGGLVSALMPLQNPIDRVAEFIAMCRLLWQGEAIRMGDYPQICTALGLREDARASFSWTSKPDVRVVVAGAGPKVLEMAGELADGVICASNFPAHSLAAFRSGQFDAVSNLDALDRGRKRSRRGEFTRIYGVNLSVSADRESACAAARRQATLIVSQQPPENLHRVGFEPSDYAATRAALKAGDGVDAAADLLPQEVADQLVVSGTPGDCIEALAELLGYAEDAGFTEAYIGAPVGPDPREAVELLTSQVLPELA